MINMLDSSCNSDGWYFPRVSKKLFLLIIFVWGITRNHQVLREAAQHVTRFISLAQVGNPDKKKVHLILNDLSCVFNRTHIICIIFLYRRRFCDILWVLIADARSFQVLAAILG